MKDEGISKSKSNGEGKGGLIVLLPLSSCHTASEGQGGVRYGRG